MAISVVEGVRIAGIAAVVPTTVVDNQSLTIFDDDERAKVIQTTGIQRRRKADPGVCTSDLCFEATQDLFASTGCAPEDIGLLIFVSQTPDYVLPATAAVLVERLGLPHGCAAFDVNLGCSGYTYGLWQAGLLLRGLGDKKALLLVGDIGRYVSPEDRSAIALFGDCGTATLLENHPDAAPMIFDLGTDGSGAKHLIVPAGQSRIPWSPEQAERIEGVDGNRRSPAELFMDGAQVFNFTLKEVPKSVKAAMAAADWAVDAVDGFVFHQANKFMLDYLAKRCGAPADKVKFSIQEYGNTSSATIPLTLAYAMADDLAAKPNKILASGFGVGWSWASCACVIGPIPRPTLRET